MACYAVKHQREQVTTNSAELMAGVFAEMRLVSSVELMLLCLLLLLYVFLIRRFTMHVVCLMFTTVKDVYGVLDVFFALLN